MHLKYLDNKRNIAAQSIIREKKKIWFTKECYDHDKKDFNKARNIFLKYSNDEYQVIFPEQRKNITLLNANKNAYSKGPRVNMGQNWQKSICTRT